MGNEQSGPDAVGSDAGTVPSSMPSTPRPILRHSAGNFQQQQQQQQQQQLPEERSRRSVIFRDLTDDALRFNHSILKGAGTEEPDDGNSRGIAVDGGGLARLSQVNNLSGNGGSKQIRPFEVEAPTAQKRLVRAQKPPAPKPPQPHVELSTQKSDLDDPDDPPQADDHVARMRAHVFTLAERKEKRMQLEVGPYSGRLYDPSAKELPTVAEEKEEKEDASRRNSGLYKMDSSETLREEIKQEILSELLQSRIQTSETKPDAPPSVNPQTEEKAKAVAYKKLTEDDKRRLIADIRQQLLASTPQSLSPAIKDSSDSSGWRGGLDTPEPEPDYSEDDLASPSLMTPGRLPRFASQLELPGTFDVNTAFAAPNGHYRVPQVQMQRRYKGPAPAPPNARFRRTAGPPVVREPYQTFSEEPIFAYGGTQAPQDQLQEQQEQLEKAYDDRYRQRSRSKRFGDSWKRMTASLSKAFGFSSGGGGGGADAKASNGVGRRSSVRDSTYQRPLELQHSREANLPTLGSGRAGSVYSLANVEMPMPQQPTTIARIAVGSQQPLDLVGAAASPPVDIWRDVAIASHDQMQLHTKNPVYTPTGTEDATTLRSNGYPGGESVGTPSSPNGGGPSRVQPGVPVSARLHAFREQTYL